MYLAEWILSVRQIAYPSPYEVMIASEISIVMTGHLLKNGLLSWLASDTFAFTYWPVGPTLILHVRSINTCCNEDPIFTISTSGYATGT